MKLLNVTLFLSIGGWQRLRRSFLASGCGLYYVYDDNVDRQAPSFFLYLFLFLVGWGCRSQSFSLPLTFGPVGGHVRTCSLCAVNGVSAVRGVSMQHVNPCCEASLVVRLRQSVSGGAVLYVVSWNRTVVVCLC